MDKPIIAPGPDMKWHVSTALDRRLPDHQKLLEPDGERIILPRDSLWHPKDESLRWRIEQLLQG